jgi:hypothetical protein
MDRPASAVDELLEQLLRLEAELPPPAGPQDHDVQTAEPYQGVDRDPTPRRRAPVLDCDRPRKPATIAAA